jgi:queuine tRNA-ribosyltransferase
MAREMLGPTLLSIHNLTYYQRLVSDARSAIERDQFEQFRMEKLRGWSEEPGARS